VLANVGGVEMNRPTIAWLESGNQAYVHVDKNKQRQAVKFLIDQVLTYQPWLFGSPLSKQIYPLRNTPNGVIEQAPLMLQKNQQNYILWDLLSNERIVRMFENEWENGDKAFTAVEMMQMLHDALFGKTLAGKKLDVMERSVQKSFIDALITAAAEGEGVKINKSLADQDFWQMICPEETALL